MGRSAQTHQLHVACDGYPHVGGKLAMKMEFREVCDAAQRVHRQVALEVRIDVSEYGVEALRVNACGVGVSLHSLDVWVVRLTIWSLMIGALRLAVLAGYPDGVSDMDAI